MSCLALLAGILELVLFGLVGTGAGLGAALWIAALYTSICVPVSWSLSTLHSASSLFDLNCIKVEEAVGRLPASLPGTARRGNPETVFEGAEGAARNILDGLDALFQA